MKNNKQGILALSILGSLTTAAALLGYLGRYYWLWDMLSHFQVQYLVVIGVIILGLLGMKSWIALCFIPFWLLSLTQTIPLYQSPTRPHRTTDSLSVACINLLSSNLEHDLVRQYLAQQQADVVILQEYNLVWQEALTEYVKDYDYQLMLPRSDNFGMALLSLVPMEGLRVVEIGISGIPTLLGTFQLGGQAVTLIATHPRPPVGQTQFLERNRHLADLGKLVRENPNQVMVIGDLNISSFSVHFSDLLDTSGLTDSRAGFGPQATWPSWGFPLRTTLDHCLLTPRLATLDRRVGPKLGSDHLPVWIKIGAE